MRHKFNYAWNKSTMGYLCRTDLRAGIILFVLLMSIYFIELKFIYLTLFSLCYLNDFSLMISQEINNDRLKEINILKAVI